ncbi:hypothetical protein Pst134EA_021468 [Puccinia striiformis f. sp. tritici]|uniref:hypothetical protein n=1 Tax=Puccinia striiformis f. sp. tritici TaxID=168172 RepID=UPI00200850CF|nr:hypothetical protein Pst134EA_021468 [Puccinia striiformis f. sp. tritici]KAH9457594.1 hypothetical protein Pst134EA_021468 [Puccinia striiformis f. sp. tritici]
MFYQRGFTIAIWQNLQAIFKALANNFFINRKILLIDQGSPAQKPSPFGTQANNNTSSLFENSLSTQNTPLIFGTQTQAPSNPTQTDNLFGNSSNNQPNSLFGATNQSAAPQTNSLFGNLSSNDTSQAGTQSSNLFGNLSNNNNTGTSHPGAQPTNLFGSLTNDNTPQPGIQTTNLFGSLSNNNSNNTTQPGQSSNLFGSLSNTNNNNSTTQPGQSSYLFESLSNNNNSNTTQSATQSNNLFGSLSNNNLSTTGFGGQSTTTPANNYLYNSSLNQSTSLTTNNTLSTLRSSTAQLARRPITLSELLIQDWIIKIHASWKVSVEIVTLKCGHMSNATQIQTRLVEIQIRLVPSSALSTLFVPGPWSPSSILILASSSFCLVLISNSNSQFQQSLILSVNSRLV